MVDSNIKIILTVHISQQQQKKKSLFRDFLLISNKQKFNKNIYSFIFYCIALKRDLNICQR